MTNELRNFIDYTIKTTWIYDIQHDYENHYLLREDCLKNSLYYHLRSKLGTILEKHHLRIYTEYNFGELQGTGKRADIVIADQFDTESSQIHFLIELKYKDGIVKPEILMQDINKTLKYKKVCQNCQYYLGFIHECSYSSDTDLSWLDHKDMKWAKGYVTELTGCKLDDCPDMQFYVLSHNGLNTGLDYKI